ncbi:serine/threonine-protein phosphatase 2A 56 kDa regulatory subunit epsilon isoform isoform X1 [Tachysurus ichikawai]
MSSAATSPPSVDKVDGFSRKSVRKAKQKRSQSSSQFRSQGKPIELIPLPLLKGQRSVCEQVKEESFLTLVQQRCSVRNSDQRRRVLLFKRDTAGVVLVLCVRLIF